MKTPGTEDQGGQPPLTPRLRIGHYGEQLFPTALLAGSALMCLTPGGNPYTLAVNLAIAVLGFAGMLYGALWHQGSLCGLCAARFPLKAPALAEAKNRQLRFVHMRWDRPRLFFGLSVLPVVPLVVIASFDPPHPVVKVYYSLTFVVPFVYDLNAKRVHNRLWPWCPYCRRGGGGGRAETPAPEPGLSRG